MHWQPPQKALDKVKELVWDPTISSYGPDEGLPELRKALQKKVIAQDTNILLAIFHESNTVTDLVYTCFLVFLL